MWVAPVRLLLYGNVEGVGPRRRSRWLKDVENLDRVLQSGLVRAIFMTRELVLGGKSEKNQLEMGLVDQANAWGWSTLAEQRGREIVFGAATRPWVANPVFRGLSPAEFRNFQQPGFVKIAWTLRADSIDPANSIASTETRVAATDAAGRAKFRRYWAFVSPGIILIRLLALRRVRMEAERSETIPLVPDRCSWTDG